MTQDAYSQQITLPAETWAAIMNLGMFRFNVITPSAVVKCLVDQAVAANEEAGLAPALA